MPSPSLARLDRPAPIRRRAPGLIGGAIGYSLLKVLGGGWPGTTGRRPRLTKNRSKLDVLLGPALWQAIRGHVVIDFGCGAGAEAVVMAARGARRVIGLDIRDAMLAAARRRAEQAGVADRCTFATRADEKADVIVSIDAFEHFDDPAAILRLMRSLLKPNGTILIAFGPPWLHPLGGHLFSVFPWAHLLFSERALIRWRADFKSDGATRFSEVAGGLNQMTVGRFAAIVAGSGLEIESFEAVPIRRLKPLSNRFTREFVTSVVKCTLRNTASGGPASA